jgi:hypothetical protein
MRDRGAIERARFLGASRDEAKTSLVTVLKYLTFSFSFTVR